VNLKETNKDKIKHFGELSKIAKLKQHFSNDLIILYYRGVFSDSFSDVLVTLAEHESHKSVKKKLNFLMIEVFQNIIRHGKSIDQENAGECFGVRSIQDGLYIYSSNNIGADSYKSLLPKLNQVNNLDRDELKMLYREILEGQKLSDKGGAGLGLIEMARRSGNPIQFHFENEENGKYQFNYQLDLSAERGVVLDNSQKIDIKDNMESFGLCSESKVLFLFKGDFKKDNVRSLVSILKANTKSDKADVEFYNFKIFHTAVELIQNISRHAKNVGNFKEGLFCLVETPSGFYVCTGNYMQSGEFSEMESHLNIVNQYSLSELKNVYLQTLKMSALEETSSAKVGLIDVRRYCETQIDYEVNNKDLGLYLSLGVHINVK
jgi:hypothetical protein